MNTVEAWKAYLLEQEAVQSWLLGTHLETRAQILAALPASIPSLDETLTTKIRHLDEHTDIVIDDSVSQEDAQHFTKMIDGLPTIIREIIAGTGTTHVFTNNEITPLYLAHVPHHQANSAIPDVDGMYLPKHALSISETNETAYGETVEDGLHQLFIRQRALEEAMHTFSAAIGGTLWKSHIQSRQERLLDGFKQRSSGTKTGFMGYHPDLVEDYVKDVKDLLNGKAPSGARLERNANTNRIVVVTAAGDAYDASHRLPIELDGITIGGNHHDLAYASEEAFTVAVLNSIVRSQDAYEDKGLLGASILFFPRTMNHAQMMLSALDEIERERSVLAEGLLNTVEPTAFTPTSPPHGLGRLPAHRTR